MTACLLWYWIGWCVGWVIMAAIGCPAQDVIVGMVEVAAVLGGVRVALREHWR
jgi:hypothetical protein